MTPIPPDKLKLYPPDWKAIRAEVMLRAAGGSASGPAQCECTGECGLHRPVPYCECGHQRDEHLDGGGCTRCPDRRGRRCGAFTFTHVRKRRCGETHGSVGRFMHGTVVLTVAHLWRGPCAPCHENGEKCGHRDHLKAMCQRCHNCYDMPERQLNAAVTRRERKRNGELFGVEP